jgi:hypothetical protein
LARRLFPVNMLLLPVVLARPVMVGVVLAVIGQA